MSNGLTILAALCLITGCTGSDEPALAERASAGVRESVTVSGVSSGAYMATQFHVAYSTEVAGAGLIAGGPWGCARGDVARALGPCIHGAGIDVAQLGELARGLAADGGIDPLASLAADRVFLFHGLSDTVVSGDVVQAAARWYRSIVDGIDIEYVDSIDAAHGIPTESYGAPCNDVATPFLNACGYDLAGAMLSHLYGEVDPPGIADGELLRISQGPAPGLAASGYAYVPAQCLADTRCRVHVFFHGCAQSAEQVGTDVVQNAGFNRWADSNDLLVLYPQVAPSDVAPQNPLGCWDWWGYSGANYLRRDGAQLTAVREMVRKLRDDLPDVPR